MNAVMSSSIKRHCYPKINSFKEINTIKLMKTVPKIAFGSINYLSSKFTIMAITFYVCLKIRILASILYFLAHSATACINCMGFEILNLLIRVPSLPLM
jgi:hypothetical protein